MRTPITYYGGKTNMLPHLLPLIPDHRVYVEGFAGGAALFWAKKPSPIEVLIDKNGEVSNFYRVMKLDFDSLCKEIEATLHCEYTFNKAKAIYKSPEGHTELQRAWAFWVSANMSFGGEVGGSFQWVRHHGDNWHPAIFIANRRKEFKYYKSRLKHVTIRTKKIEDLIFKLDGNDVFFYLDPPYVGARQGHYSGYTEEMFLELLQYISAIDGKFLLSSYPHKTLNKFAKKKGWNQISIDMKRGVQNGRKTEVITWNYDIKTSKTLTLF